MELFPEIGRESVENALIRKKIVIIRIIGFLSIPINS